MARPIMRLAIVAASSYEENGQVSPIPNAELDVELFGSRLAEADAGFAVHAFPAQRGLADAMESLIAGLGERPEALIFYFWGYALQSKEHGPTLLLDGPKLSSFTLARLRRLAADAADVSLVVLDTTLAEGSTGEPLDAVRAMGRALSHGDSTVSSLISARSPEQRVAQGPPPFTGLLQMILDAQTGSESALTPETLFRAMQSEEVMFADIPAAGLFPRPARLRGGAARAAAERAAAERRARRAFRRRASRRRAFLRRRASRRRRPPAAHPAADAPPSVPPPPPVPPPASPRRRRSAARHVPPPPARAAEYGSAAELSTAAECAATAERSAADRAERSAAERAAAERSRRRALQPPSVRRSAPRAFPPPSAPPPSVPPPPALADHPAEHPSAERARPRALCTPKSRMS